MRIRSGQTCIAVLSFAVSIVSSAHHGSPGYDTDRTIALRGAVTGIQWTNPHIFITIQAQDQNGDRVDWLIESASPHFLSRVGFDRETLTIGEEVEILISPAIGADRVAAWGRAIVKPDGTRYELHSQATFFRDGADAVRTIRGRE